MTAKIERLVYNLLEEADKLRVAADGKRHLTVKTALLVREDEKRKLATRLYDVLLGESEDLVFPNKPL